MTTSVQYKSFGVKWRPLPAHLAPAQERITKILYAWKGTPYMVGQQARGAGVDCIRFCSGVIDEIERRPRTPIETLPPDASMHNRAGAIATMKKIRELYLPNDPVEDGWVEPADIMVIGPNGGGPGHAMIVGGKPGELWHATARGVTQTGVAFADTNYQIFRIYRKADREKWL